MYLQAKYVNRIEQREWNFSVCRLTDSLLKMCVISLFKQHVEKTEFPSSLLYVLNLPNVEFDPRGSPFQPSGHVHLYSERLMSVQVAPFWHGLSLHALEGTAISQKLAV